ncbi:hypothetical protein CC85DRAFT_328572 [Cutaneotrichosporon oleaginosum]|uniref:Uncharacterized protein n=1 Tax=Cutaneotrichosporon oleaginosum TaxID=879819 RepID=A0A0J0XLN7_9TREE|nr:uncharacterized protein CC85DRAFT_328572 [Cutaneotrichosporon oleaginosum]KLT42010.1 hypothetical protein CC85DRAFT_328572 [Cutaneotrichosporon oleaginosum]TXT14333.1 hypothetical protein COLE_00526 [Cutaneotrichosporon oleaginosum]
MSLLALTLVSFVSAAPLQERQYTTNTHVSVRRGLSPTFIGIIVLCCFVGVSIFVCLFLYCRRSYHPTGTAHSVPPVYEANASQVQPAYANATHVQPASYADAPRRYGVPPYDVEMPAPSYKSGARRSKSHSYSWNSHSLAHDSAMSAHHTAHNHAVSAAHHTAH